MKRQRGYWTRALFWKSVKRLCLIPVCLGLMGKMWTIKTFVVDIIISCTQNHRDLDINFSQILPASISVSELGLMKQGLRPLHRQIWDFIVDRIRNKYPKKIDLLVVKQVLAHA